MNSIAVFTLNMLEMNGASKYNIAYDCSDQDIQIIEENAHYSALLLTTVCQKSRSAGRNTLKMNRKKIKKCATDEAVLLYV